LATALNKVKNADHPFQVMIDAIPMMAWCSPPDGSVEFLNQPWHDYMGLSPEEAHGWGWKVTIHPTRVTYHALVPHLGWP